MLYLILAIQLTKSKPNMIPFLFSDQPSQRLFTHLPEKFSIKMQTHKSGMPTFFSNMGSKRLFVSYFSILQFVYVANFGNTSTVCIYQTTGKWINFVFMVTIL